MTADDTAMQVTENAITTLAVQPYWTPSLARLAILQFAIRAALKEVDASDLMEFCRATMNDERESPR